MRIAVVNRSGASTSDVADVVHAINRQLIEHFAPEWSWFARCVALGANANIAAIAADAVVFVVDDDADGYLGYHDMDARGLPYGYVYRSVAAMLGEAWSVTLSHEVLELVGDSTCNSYAAGPHPDGSGRTVMHWWEMCDAVQARSYQIEGVEVSDFVLPHYFTPTAELGRSNAHLGGSLRSFGIAPGGYVGYWDPRTGTTETHFADLRAAERWEIKRMVAPANRRSSRYTRAANVHAQADEGGGL